MLLKEPCILLDQLFHVLVKRLPLLVLQERAECLQVLGQFIYADLLIRTEHLFDGRQPRSRSRSLRVRVPPLDVCLLHLPMMAFCLELAYDCVDVVFEEEYFSSPRKSLLGN